MKFEIRPYLRLEVARMALLVTALAWSSFATVMVIRTQPRLILIGLDANGTRLITSQNDPLVVQERVKFVKDILFRLYNYDGSNYLKRMDSAGDLMSDPLWQEHEPEFKRIAEQMKGRPLRAEAKLLDLRELDEQTFEVDVAVHIMDRLVFHDTRLRVTLSIGSRKRNVDNPYAWEVTALHENELH